MSTPSTTSTSTDGVFVARATKAAQSPHSTIAAGDPVLVIQKNDGIDHLYTSAGQKWNAYAVAFEIEQRPHTALDWPWLAGLTEADILRLYA